VFVPGSCADSGSGGSSAGSSGASSGTQMGVAIQGTSLSLTTAVTAFAGTAGTSGSINDTGQKHLAQCEKLKYRHLLLTLLLVLVTGLALAQPAPQFWIRNLEGQRFDSRKVGEESIVVSFFFVNCIPCLKEIPELHAFISKELPAVHLLFIDPLKEDSKQDMIGFAERLGVPQKFFYKDGLGTVSRKFFRGVQQAFPTIVGIKGRQELFRLSGLPEGALDQILERL